MNKAFHVFSGCQGKLFYSEYPKSSFKVQKLTFYSITFGGIIVENALTIKPVVINCTTLLFDNHNLNSLSLSSSFATLTFV